MTVCLAQDSSPKKIQVRVEITRFIETKSIARVKSDEGTYCLYINEIEFRVLEPSKFLGMRVVEQGSGSKAGSPYTTVGNILDASVEEQLFDPKNVQADGRILAYTLGYSGLVNLRLVTGKQASDRSEDKNQPNNTSEPTAIIPPPSTTSPAPLAHR